jgi:hypothetical protein
MCIHDMQVGQSQIYYNLSAIAFTQQICSKKSADKVQQKGEIDHRSGAGKG